MHCVYIQQARAYFAVILLQVSPCNERAVLDQLSDHLKKRLAGYKSSSTIEVSRCIGFYQKSPINVGVDEIVSDPRACMREMDFLP